MQQVANIPQPRRNHRLADHVRACEVDGRVVLLDLRNGRYLGIAGVDSSALAGHVEGWPQTVSVSSTEADTCAGAKILEKLESIGILTESIAHAPPAVWIDQACTTMRIDFGQTPRYVGIARALRVLGSIALAISWMRVRSLDAIAQALDQRRARHHRTAAPSLEAIRASTAAFAVLRPFVYTARDKCLLDSLALAAFLAAEGHCARWVIGVAGRPFAAHSWVQSGDTVLNDEHEYVRQFRPILVV